ncbi:MAG: diguanylate cyclase [Planctomycetota bacterium]|nr:diguanylate cyclase [Planctomycetota bacterium]
MRILIVSDDAAVREVLRRTLEAYGHEVRTADDGEQASATLAEEPADVVISDWVMPGEGGLALCRRIRAAQDHAYTYFILVTSVDRQHNLDTALEAGVDDYLTKPLSVHELKMRLHVAERITRLQAEVGERQRSLEESNQRLFETGRRDPLTNLWNRRQLRDDLRQLMQLAKRYKRRVSIAMCDIDDFKLYNDRYGHVAGDEILVRVAEVLKAESRGSDRVYRYGGEEFVITFPEVELEEATAAVERLRERIEALGMPHPDVGPRDVLTISAGVCALDLAIDDSPEAWIARADRAMYAAKEAGRNHVVVADGS